MIWRSRPSGGGQSRIEPEDSPPTDAPNASWDPVGGPAEAVKAYQDPGGSSTGTVLVPVDPALPPSSAPSTASDDLAADLMRLIGEAIRQWTKRHRLENLPPDIVMDMVMQALNGVQRVQRDVKGQWRP